MRIELREWNFIAFTYHSFENWGTFHINNAFGYSDTTAGVDQPVSHKIITLKVNTRFKLSKLSKPSI